jgi:hypothetical protein
MTTRNTAQTHDSQALPEYSDDKRLAVFRMLTAACTHLYSKGKLQREKFDTAAAVFADLAKNDPLFMVHLTAYSATKDSKDMRALTVMFNANSDADGTPFFPGATRNKPNFRKISNALLQECDPHLALRILELCHVKFGVPGVMNDAYHFPGTFQKAYAKYLRYREQNPEMLRGIRRSGLGNKFRQIYRLSHTGPCDEAVDILNWKQKDGRAPKSEKLPDFNAMTPKQIADYITNKKLSVMVALSIIPPNKITASVGRVIMDRCSGNQAIILYRWFAKNGLLDVPDIAAMFPEKVRQSTTAVDRIDTLSRDADEGDRKIMNEARSQKRKADAKTSEIGKIFMHIDVSQSMTPAIEFAKERAGIIAECVDNPKENFRWGTFAERGRMLDVPDSFTKEDFHAAMYGVRAAGMTDCIALYPEARRFGAEVDVYVTDQGHNVGSIFVRINQFHANNPDLPKPRAVVIVDYKNHRWAEKKDTLEAEFRRLGIPFALIEPETLDQSALIAASVRNACKGELVVIEEIMNTPLPVLPNWYATV